MMELEKVTEAVRHMLWSKKVLVSVFEITERHEWKK